MQSQRTSSISEPTRFGSYHLLHPLSRGDNSTIYLGEHISSNMRVAIKLLNRERRSGQSCQRFLQEACQHARLCHPHIVRVLDFGIEDETPYLIMEYAPRGTLCKRFPYRMPFLITTILPYLLQIASALQYVHNHSLVHCDVKPQNILLNPGCGIWLSDFGIAVPIHQREIPWQYRPAGTAAYAAPECIEGRPTHASDQYSLAVLAYTWLCGRHPFQGSPSQLCYQHLYLPPTPLRVHIPSVQPAVEQVILRALAKDPCQRFEHVQDFALALKFASKR